MTKWLITAPITLAITALLLAGCGAAPPSADSGSQPVAAVTQTADGYAATPTATPAPGDTTVQADVPTMTVVPTPAVPPVAKPMLPQGANVLFSADFDNGSMNGWTIVNPSDPYGEPALWAVREGHLIQNGDASGELSGVDTIAKAGNEGWTNYTLSAQLLGTSGDLMGLTFRQTSAGYYQLVMAGKPNTGQPGIWLEKVVGGKTTRLAESSSWAGYDANTWYPVSVTVQGSSIKVSVANQQLFDVNDTSLPSGAIGMYATANGGAWFDNVLVTK
ncbi:MAG: DUF1080 domain-containing protein [Chloroflexi bacterium]|nr:DUF1080 domain-containing protein [Chloroflexota bacterium]